MVEIKKYDLKEVRKMAREFAENEFRPEVAKLYEDENSYPQELRKKAAKELLPLINDSIMAKVITIEEMCRVNPGLGITIAEQPIFGSDLIDLYGTPEQKEKILAGIRRGDFISGLAVTEPGGGSDVTSLKTTAKKTDEGYILNGTKMFITNGNVADYIIVLARTSEEENRHKGMTTFIVDTKSKGFTANRLTGKMGVRASVTSELLFDNVFVTEEYVLGEVGRGFYQVMDYFNRSRINVAAMSVGVAQGALDQIMNHILSVRKHDTAAYSDEGNLFELSEIATKVHLSRILTYDAARMVTANRPDPMITSMAKKFASETAVYVSRKVSKIMGVHGITGAPETFFRDSKIMDIWEGTSEIENLVIGRTLLKNGGITYE